MAEQVLSTIRRPGWGCPMSQQEIATLWGVSRVRVHQVEQAALAKLRKRAAEDPELCQFARDLGLVPD